MIWNNQSEDSYVFIFQRCWKSRIAVRGLKKYRTVSRIAKCSFTKRSGKLAIWEWSDIIVDNIILKSARILEKKLVVTWSSAMKFTYHWCENARNNNYTITNYWFFLLFLKFWTVSASTNNNATNITLVDPRPLVYPKLQRVSNFNISVFTRQFKFKTYGSLFKIYVPLLKTIPFLTPVTFIQISKKPYIYAILALNVKQILCHSLPPWGSD